ncbi:FAD-binding oxidoreductase [Cupriavidus pauculus]|uniref:Hydroxyacid dehydrogenase n=1 Tax=Cupriavidus pauculus TaxID=82633 RepID=A0A2N5CDG1_9BURK|nr:FAD-binding oxidoreductase [Cupriavidus pauculus]PLQ00256.1 hydroxyacid dehydrogenase [Cupriavidus pauculus]
MTFDAQAWLAEARSLIGETNVLTPNREEDLSAFVKDWRGKFQGPALAVLRPATTAEVQGLVRLAARAGVAIVPQGGNTGLCGASVPMTSGRQVVLQLGRMNKVRELDVRNNTVTVEAGYILQQLQELAASAGRLFPLSLGAEGSCQIGGNLATNAGGMQVLRYGNMRELVLGLEVVLPDGEVLDLLRALRKDNTGYDLKQLFIGSEGTLGIVTAATLKLFPLPTAETSAFAGVASLEDAISVLDVMRASMGDRFSAFELISHPALELVRQYFPDTPPLLEQDCAWYLLMKAADGGDGSALNDAMQAALMACMEQGTIKDVALASSLAQTQVLWDLRENVTHAQQMDGGNIKHDVALPISRLPAFVEGMLPELAHAFPGVRPIIYGHLGDGNLHFNVSAPDGVDAKAWQTRTDAVNKIIHDATVALRGSISAEHGVGQLKRDELLHYKTAIEMDVMHRIKKALDPQNLLNPGKVLNT